MQSDHPSHVNSPPSRRVARLLQTVLDELNSTVYGLMTAAEAATRAIPNMAVTGSPERKAAVQ